VPLRGIFYNPSKGLPLIRIEGRAPRVCGPAGVGVAPGGHVVGQKKKGIFKRRKKMAHLANAFDDRRTGGGIGHFYGYKRAKQLESTFFELWPENFRIGWKKTEGTELGAGVARFHHFVEHLFIGLVPRRTGVIKNAPTIRSASEQETLVDAGHEFPLVLLILSAFYRTIAQMSSSLWGKNGARARVKLQAL